MNLLEMPFVGHGKTTQLSQDLSITDQEITVEDASVFPSAPNYCSLGVDNNVEVVRYTGIDTANNKLTGCLRGQSGTIARAWPISSYVYNAVTSISMNNMIENINALNIPYMRQNLLINSNFCVWQRGVSFTKPNDYTADRWYTQTVSGTPIVTPNTSASGYYRGLKVTGGTIALSYKMDAYDLANIAGKKCTLTYQKNGVIQAPQTSTISAQTVVSLNLNNGEYIDWVKLEVGEESTEYIQPTYAKNLIECKRYFQKTPSFIAGSSAYNSTLGAFNFSFLEMRVAPTPSFIGDLNSVNIPGYGNFPIVSTAWYGSTSTQGGFNVNTSSSLPNFVPILFQNAISLDAEL